MGVDDYHDVLAVYTKREEENFALFRYVQSLNNEIEQLEDDKHTLERETDKYEVLETGLGRHTNTNDSYDSIGCRTRWRTATRTRVNAWLMISLRLDSGKHHTGIPPPYRKSLKEFLAGFSRKTLSLNACVRARSASFNRSREPSIASTTLLAVTTLFRCEMSSWISFAETVTHAVSLCLVPAWDGIGQLSQRQQWRTETQQETVRRPNGADGALSLRWSYQPELYAVPMDLVDLPGSHQLDERHSRSPRHHWGQHSPVPRCTIGFYHRYTCFSLTSFVREQIIEQRSSELIEQFSRRLQYKNPMELTRATLGANLKPSDPSRAAVAARAMLPDFNGVVGGAALAAVAANAPTAGPSNGSMLASILSSGSLVGTDSSIAEEDGAQNSSEDEEDEDRPMTKAELQRRAAKSLAGLQFSAKMQTLPRGKTVAASNLAANAMVSTGASAAPSSGLKKKK
jgi:hypothetical protein